MFLWKNWLKSSLNRNEDKNLSPCLSKIRYIYSTENTSPSKKLDFSRNKNANICLYSKKILKEEKSSLNIKAKTPDNKMHSGNNYDSSELQIYQSNNSNELQQKIM